MNNTLTAQELKVKGAQILKEKTKKFKEVLVTVRGENKYVVLTIEQYNYLRECELESAYNESQKNLKEGKFIIQSVEEHIKDLKNA